MNSETEYKLDRDVIAGAVKPDGYFRFNSQNHVDVFVLRAARRWPIALDAIDTLKAENARLQAENQRLRGVLDKLPVAADGVPIVPRMKVFWRSANPDTSQGIAVDSVDDRGFQFFSGGELLSMIPDDGVYSSASALAAASSARIAGEGEKR